MSCSFGIPPFMFRTIGSCSITDFCSAVVNSPPSPGMYPPSGASSLKNISSFSALWYARYSVFLLPTLPRFVNFLTFPIRLSVATSKAPSESTFTGRLIILPPLVVTCSARISPVSGSYDVIVYGSALLLIATFWPTGSGTVTRLPSSLVLPNSFFTLFLFLVTCNLAASCSSF